MAGHVYPTTLPHQTPSVGMHSIHLRQSTLAHARADDCNWTEEDGLEATACRSDTYVVLPKNDIRGRGGKNASKWVPRDHEILRNRSPRWERHVALFIAHPPHWTAVRSREVVKAGVADRVRGRLVDHGSDVTGVAPGPSIEPNLQWALVPEHCDDLFELALR